MEAQRLEHGSARRGSARDPTMREVVGFLSTWTFLDSRILRATPYSPLFTLTPPLSYTFLPPLNFSEKILIFFARDRRQNPLDSRSAVFLLRY